MLTLHTLRHPKGAKRKRKVVGRGNAAGGGTYAGRGLKGQKSRTGGRKGLKRKGLRMMLLRIPKRRGLGNPQGQRTRVVNLGTLNTLIADGARVDQAALVSFGLVGKRTERLKVLGDGAWTRKAVSFVGLAFSAPARAKVQAAGGNIE